jgi:hypothetical protein
MALRALMADPDSPTEKVKASIVSQGIEPKPDGWLVFLGKLLVGSFLLAVIMTGSAGLAYGLGGGVGLATAFFVAFVLIISWAEASRR